MIVERNDGEKSGSVILEMLLVIILGSTLGVVMALASSGFVLGVGALGALRGTASAHLPETLQALSPFAPLLTLLLAAGAVLLVRRLFSITRWHGPADSILAAHQSGNTLDVKAGLGSTLAAFLSAGGGASVGQYGPLVHFGATVAALVAKLRRTRVRADTFIGCGVAAAISAGFNAPLAGMVFAHEAILPALLLALHRPDLHRLHRRFRNGAAVFRGGGVFRGTSPLRSYRGHALRTDRRPPRRAHRRSFPP